MTDAKEIDGPQSTSDIQLARVAVRSFRCIDEIELDLESGTTYLVGENNSGKTSILLALLSAVGSRRPVDDDLRRADTDTPAGEASVDLFIVPTEGPDFAPETVQQLLHVQRDPATGSAVVGIRLAFKPSREGRWLTTRRTFLQPNNDGKWELVSAPALPPALMGRVEAHLLDASRDLVSELGNRSSVWGRVLSDLQIEENPPQGDSRADLEEALADIAARIRDASPVLETLQTDLARLADAQAGIGKVELQPLPLRLEELARAAEVVLHQDDRAALPLRFHGLGSRSLATMFVFQTLAKLRLGADRETQLHLVTLLEEPEAHLHPQAISALGWLLDRLPGQRIVSTHSPQLVAHADPRSIRIIRRSTDKTKVIGLPPETAKRVAQFRRYVERPFGEILFARALVLCDGTSERCTLPILLAKHFDCHPGGLGVSFVDCESMNREQTGIIIQAAHELELPWFVFTDNDDAGQIALGNIKHPETGRKLETDSPEVVMSGAKQIEQLLIDAGYKNEIEAVAHENNSRDGGGLPSGKKPHLTFLKRNKAWASEQVAVKAMEANRPLPSSVKELARRLEAVLGAPKAFASRPEAA